MTQQRLRAGLVLLLTLCLTAIAVLAAAAAAPRLGSGSRAFELLAFGLAGVMTLVVAAVALSPAWLLSIGLALSIFSGNWKYMHVPGPLDRLVVAVAIAAIILRSFFDPDAPRIEIRRLHWLLALLTLYTLGSAAWAGTLFHHDAFFALLDRLGIEPFLLFLVAPSAFTTADDRRILLVTLTVIGGYLGLLAIFEVIGPHALVFPRYINNPGLGLHYGRARGPFLEAGADGLAMFSSAVASAMLIAEGRGRTARSALILVIGLCVLGIILSETRQVWLGAAAGGIIVCLLEPRLRRRLPVGLILTAALVGALYYGVPTLKTQLKTRTDDQRSLWDRYNSDEAALRMFESRPLLGFGWFEFPDQSSRYYHVARTYPLTDVAEVHNVVLSNAAEIGFVGAAMWLIVVFIGMLTPVMRRGPPQLRPWVLAGLAIAIAWFVQSNFAPVTYAFDNYVPWVFAAIAFGPIAGSVRSPALSPARTLGSVPATGSTAS
jgi:putative inorganic carbon (HCO3(-)) transporter